MLDKIFRIALREIRVNFNFLLFRACAAAGKSAPRAGDAIGTGRVGILRPDLIGDFVLFTEALKHYRALYPDSKLCLIGNPLWQELAEWISANGIVEGSGSLFDEFVPVSPARLVNGAYFRQAARLVSRHEILINAVISRTNATDKLVGACRGLTIGAISDNTNILSLQRRLNNRFYRRLLPNPRAQLEIEKNIEFVENLSPGGALPKKAPKWKIPDVLAARVLQGLSARCHLSLPEVFVAVSPLARAGIRQWPLDKYERLMANLSTLTPDLHFVFLGGPPRSGEEAEFSRRAAGMGKVVELLGKTSLIEAAVLIRRSVLSISAETAACHLASAVGTNNVVIMGGGHHGRCFPYPSPWGGCENVAVVSPMDCFRCNWFCKYRLFGNRPAPCVANIGVEEVEKEARRLLAASKRN